MKKITIKNTDLELSPMGMGCVNAGSKWDGKDAFRIFDAFLDMGGSPGDVYRRSSGGDREGIAAESACLRDPAGRTSRFSYIHLPGVSGTGTTVVGGNFLCNEKQVRTSVTGYGRSVKKNRM